jgi:uncharacterized RDD family membrane protein YckC
MNSPETPSEKEGPLKAGLLNRIIAKAIDFIIIGAMLEIIPVAGYFAGLLYLLIADGLIDGRSVGKWLIGLRVVAKGSEPLRSCGFKEAIIRNILFAAAYLLFGLLKGIPLIGLILSFVVIAAVLLFEGLVMLGSEDGSRIGDEIAGTLVIEER